MPHLSFLRYFQVLFCQTGHTKKRPRGKEKYQNTENTKIGIKWTLTDKNDTVSRWDISTLFEVFVNLKRVNVHENTVKMEPYDSFKGGMEGKEKGSYLRLIPGIWRIKLIHRQVQNCLIDTGKGEVAYEVHIQQELKGSWWDLVWVATLLPLVTLTGNCHMMPSLLCFHVHSPSLDW